MPEVSGFSLQSWVDAGSNEPNLFYSQNFGQINLGKKKMFWIRGAAGSKEARAKGD